MTLLTDAEVEALVLLQCYTAQVIDGKESTEESDMAALLEWANGVRMDAGLLEAAIKGDVFVRMQVGQAEPTFQLSPKGEASAQELIRQSIQT